MAQNPSYDSTTSTSHIDFNEAKHYVVRLFLLLFGSQRYHTDNPVENDQSLELACTMGPLLQVVNKVPHSFP